MSLTKTIKWPNSVTKSLKTDTNPIMNEEQVEDINDCYRKTLHHKLY